MDHDLNENDLAVVAEAADSVAATADDLADAYEAAEDDPAKELIKTVWDEVNASLAKLEEPLPDDPAEEDPPTEGDE